MDSMKKLGACMGACGLAMTLGVAGVSAAGATSPAKDVLGVVAADPAKDAGVFDGKMGGKGELSGVYAGLSSGKQASSLTAAVPSLTDAPPSVEKVRKAGQGSEKAYYNAYDVEALGVIAAGAAVIVGLIVAPIPTLIVGAVIAVVFGFMFWH